MGYSKWRKILTILMIINMIFILFAKFSKVFGAYVIIDDEEITIDSFFDNNYSNYFIWNNGNNYFFVAATDPLTVDDSYYHFNSSGKSYYTTSKSVLISTLQTYRQGNFTSYNSGETIRLSSFPINNIIFSNYDILNSNGNIVYPATGSVSPYFTPSTTKIQNLEFNHLGVEPGSWDYTTNPLYLHILEVTNIVDMGNNTSTYYYADDVIRLDNNSKYFEQFLDSDTYYFYIPKYVFAFIPDTQYLLVLNDTASTINNSNGIIEKNVENNIFESVLIDTTDKITVNDTLNDNISNIKDDISENTVSSETETELENSLQFDNTNEDVENINNGFFSRLSTMISSLADYDLGEDTTIDIPMPNSDEFITLHSNILYNNITGVLRLIINAFWIYLFSFYLFKFVNKIYIAISTGNILDTFSSNGEAITNNML